MTSHLRVACPAKVNLTLEILGRRTDGYHELRTIFQAVGLADELTVGPGDAPLTVSGLEVPLEGNLCLQAVEAFRREAPVPHDLSIHLHKRLPLGSGLGGGSSDAAGVLAALDHAYGPLPPGKLAQLAAGLGSDVAFFLAGGTALGQGRGEILEPLPGPTAEWLVLARPEVHVSTAAAYGALRPEDFTTGAATAALAEKLRAGYGLRAIALDLYNGFERAVLQRYPAIAATRQQLLQAGAQAALLSGSGAAVFGLFAGEQAACQAAATLRAAGLWAQAVRTITSGVRVAEES